MIACLRLPDLPPAARRLDRILALLAELSPNVEAEGPLELRADARRRRIPYALPAAQLDEQQAATCYADLGKLTTDEAVTAAHSIHRLVSTYFRLSPTLGIAAGKFTARLAAASSMRNEIAVVTPGQEAEFVAEFPVSALPIDGETLRQLHLLGLRTLGQLAALPASALLDRFGKPGQLMHRLASGRDTSRVAPYRPPVTLEARQAFDWSVDRQPVLLNSIETLVARLAKQLACEGQTAGQVTLRLALEDGGALERTLALRQPTANPVHLMRTLEAMLHSMHIATGVTALRLTLGGVRQPAAQQLSLFDREPVSQARLRAALAGLVARHGECFYRAVVLDERARLLKRQVGFKKVEMG